MNIERMLFSKSTLDFLYLFFSNIFQKLLGLIRELVIAFFLGSSILYANFLLLRVVADLFSQLTAGNALKANLLPKFTKAYNKENKISLVGLFRFAKSTSIYLFIGSQIIQTGVIFYLNLENSILFFSASLVLSFSISFNFINTVFLTILQAKGQFLKFSFASTLNSSIFTILVYPFISLFSILGLAVSRVLGILGMTFAYVIPLRKENKGEELTVSNSDFNIPTLILGNFANVILISSRFIAGVDGSNSITYFMYAVVVLNTLLTSVVGNIGTLVLRKSAIQKDIKMIIYSLLIAIVVGVSMVFVFQFYGEDIINIIYVRGAFNVNDAILTSEYLSKLSYSFVGLFVATTLFRPFLSTSIEKTKKIRINLMSIFLMSIVITSLVVLFLPISTINSTIIVMSISSFVSVMLSIYSYSKYLSYES